MNAPSQRSPAARWIGAGLIVTLVVANWFQWRELAALRAENTARRTAAESVGRAQAAAAEQALQAEQARAAAAAQAKASRLSPVEQHRADIAAKLAELKARHERTPFPPYALGYNVIGRVNRTVELLLDPEYAKAFRTQYLHIHETRYGDWLRSVGLSPDMTAQFIDLVLERQIESLKTQIPNGITRPATATKEGRAEYSRQLAAVQADYDARMRALVGETVFAGYSALEYVKLSGGLGETTLQGFDAVPARLSYSEYPLSPEQMQALNRMVMQISQQQRQAIVRLNYRENGEYVLSQMSAVLDPNQLVLARQWQEEQQAWQDVATNSNAAAIQAAAELARKIAAEKRE
jgi:hypothetical protein